MKKTRKVLSVVLAFLMVVASIPMSVSANSESLPIQEAASAKSESLMIQDMFSEEKESSPVQETASEKSESSQIQQKFNNNKEALTDSESAPIKSGSLSLPMSSATYGNIYVYDEIYTYVPVDDYVEFIFRPTESRAYVVSSDNYDGDSDDPLVAVCDTDYDVLFQNDDSPYEDTYDFCCVFYAYAGEEYRIVVFDYDDSGADFYLSLLPYPEVSHQPTAYEPYVEIDPDYDAYYQWYAVSSGETEITDDNIIALSQLDNTSTYSYSSGWTPAREPAVFDSSYNYYRFFDIYLNEGSSIAIETDGYVYEAIGLVGTDGDGYVRDASGYSDDTYYFNIDESGVYKLCCYGLPGLTAKVYVDGLYLTEVYGETNTRFDTSMVGDYVCLIDLYDYGYIFSDVLTITGSYDIPEIELYDVESAYISSDSYTEYMFRPAESGTYVVVSEAYGCDPKVNVYDQYYNSISYDDDNDYIDGERDFYCTFYAEAGETYIISLGEYYGNSVEYYFSVIDYSVIVHQPTKYEPYVEVEPDNIYVSYQWYSVSEYGEYSSIASETASSLSTTVPGEYVCEVDFGFGRYEFTDIVNLTEISEIRVNEISIANVPYEGFAEFVFYPAESGYYAVATDSYGDCDPIVGVFDGDFSYITENDDNEYVSDTYDSYCPFYAEAGETYYIVAMDYQGNDAEYNITIVEYAEIVHQPTENEPYVEIEPDAYADYQWYSILDGERELTDSDVLDVCELDNTSTYSESIGWTPAEEFAYEYNANYYEFFLVSLNAGDVVTVETDGMVEEAIALVSLSDEDVYYEYEATGIQDDTYTFNVGESGIYGLACFGQPGLTARVYVDGGYYSAIDGETSATLRTNEAGKYACKVTYEYGRFEMSDSFEITDNGETTTQPTTTRPVSTTQPTTRPVSTTQPTTRPVSTTRPATTRPAAELSLEIRFPSRQEIKYGDSIILHADIQGQIPAGATISWTADNSNFRIVNVSDDGRTCTITPNASGATVFTAEIVDSSGNVLDSDTQTMFANAGFFQKIIAFFKGIFGLTVVYPEVFKNMF